MNLQELAMRRLIIAFTLTTAGLSVAFAAQAKPSFAGTWIFQSTDRAPVNLGGLVVSGPDITITQDAARLTVDRMYGQIRQPLSVNLDGSPTKNAGRAGRGGTIELASVATWDGTQLQIVTTRIVVDLGRGNATRVETKEVLALDNGILVVEHTGQVFGGTDRRTTRYTFKKK